MENPNRKLIPASPNGFTIIEIDFIMANKKWSIKGVLVVLGRFSIGGI